MKLDIDIEKSIGNFHLSISLKSDSPRLGILGASGAGKSMTLRCMAGIETPDRGSIALDGKTLYNSRDKVCIRPQEREVGYMFQNYALFPTMSVRENICCGIRGGREEKADKYKKYIEQFDLKGLEDRLPHQLSGGQQQRVALARIMAGKPKLVLLDEPFSALDAYLRDRVRRETMMILEEAGITMVMVSHDRDELYSFSDELAVMRKGEILRHGRTEDVFRDPQRIETAKLTGCKNFSDCKTVSSNEVLAEEWGAVLNTGGAIAEGIRHIGYRAHDFIPVWENEDNALPFKPEYEEELPFNRNIYFRVHSESGRDSILCWAPDSRTEEMIKIKGMPDRLKLDPAKIMLLK